MKTLSINMFNILLDHTPTHVIETNEHRLSLYKLNNIKLTSDNKYLMTIHNFKTSPHVLTDASPLDLFIKTAKAFDIKHNVKKYGDTLGIQLNSNHIGGNFYQFNGGLK